jgi:dolichol kinase
MDTALRTASQDLANEVRALLEEIDPARWRDEVEIAATARANAIAERVRTMLHEGAAAGDSGAAQLRERLGQLGAAIDRAFEAMPSRESLALSMAERRARWAAFQREVQPEYEALAASLRSMTLTGPRPLRPTNYTRNVFHVSCGVSVVALVELLPSRAWLIGLPLAVGLWAWSAEVSRRVWPSVNERLMKLFGNVAHAHERHRINSSTWFVTALFLLGLAFPRYATAVGVAVLGLADPAAALVGRRFGRTKLRAGRSLQGSLAFVAVGAVASLAVLALRHHGSPGAFALTALAAAVTGALAELYTERLDDNFTIPLASASAALAVGTLLGIQ